MSKKPKTMFAECDGKLYVKTIGVMNPMIPMIDGLPIIMFKGDNRTYLSVDVAIDWCRKEAEHHSRKKYETIIAVLEKAKAQMAGHEPSGSSTQGR